MEKAPDAFRTISEVAEELNVPQHVLRFWETKFTFITPLKRAGGRRFYRPQDIVLLKAVKRLLHDDGLTIKGVQRLYREQGLKKVAVYRDDDGNLHRRSAVCPHLHGIVRWNALEKSWDCPCHGSRFDAQGRVITGPSAADLAEAD